ncbi:MAG: type VI secretion system baseplate subunit TssF, partial [Nitrospinae bacterium]|nr:type VI secretion system baseplate subunit TssF [Nitrospinota bacterium]
QTRQGEICRFRTCYPVTLWPVKVAYAGYESTDQFDFLDTASNIATVLRLKLECTGESFAGTGLKRLRFFLGGEGAVPYVLYEQLFCHTLDVAILPENGGKPVYLPKDSIAPVGFAPGEDVLPYSPFAHPGYRLLQEYFTFDDKFLFFDLDHLDRHGSKKTFDVLVLLSQRPREQMAVDRDNFKLGCAPIVNLFRKTTEPIRWDHRQTEYRLVADVRRERTTEIHSILKVSSTSDARSDTQTYQPFYSFTHQMEGAHHKAFWHARRAATGRTEIPGSDLFLTFLDLSFKPTDPMSETIYAHALCTNRDLAEQIPDGGLLQIEEAAPVHRIVCLNKPTRQILPPLGGEAQWRLISHLSLNFLSLSSDKESLKAFREILTLYSFSNRLSTVQQIMGLREMSCRKVVRRVGSDAWRGFCRGIETTLTFDESLYAGNSAFLMAAVLNRFLPLYASINTFTQLIIKSQQREGIWKKWPPLVGEQIVL